MARFYISPEAWDPERLALAGGEAHHAARVLRLGPGEVVSVFNGAGDAAEAEIVSVTGREVLLRALRVGREELPAARIGLAVAVPKGKNMDLVAQKATELGAWEIHPLLTERTVVQVGRGEDAEAKQAKWQVVCVEAAKQCGRSYVPRVSRPVGLGEFLAGLAGRGCDLLLIASLQPGALPVGRVLGEWRAAHGGRGPGSVVVLVGPEGDFSPGEVEMALGAGCRPVTLGPVVLRVETAAIYCLCVLSHELLNG